jgi:tetratricopeptide (TPR) repeat protein
MFLLPVMTLNNLISRRREQLASGTLIGYERCEALLELADLLAHSRQVESSELLREAHGIAKRLRNKRLTARAIHGLGAYCFRQLELPIALRHLKHAARLYEELGADLELADVLCFIANITTRHGHYEKAVEILDRAAILAAQCDDVTTICNVDYLRGRISMLLGEYNTTYDLYSHALKKAEAGGSVLAQARLHGALGTLFFMLEENTQALEYTESALEFFRQLGYRFEEADLLSTVGVIYDSLGDIEGARTAYNESMAIHLEVGNRSGYGFVLACLAGINITEGHYEQAHQELLESYDILKVAGTVMNRAHVLASLGRVQGELGKLDEGIIYLEQALELALEIKNQRREYSCYFILTRLYEQKGDAVRALEYHKSFVRVKSEHEDQEKRRNIAQQKIDDLIYRADLEKKELRLKAERLALEMEYKSKELTSIALSLVQKNELISDLQHRVNEFTTRGDANVAALAAVLAEDIARSGDNDEGWKAFEHQFEMVHADFFRRLAEQGGSLTPTEMKVCSLLRINLSSKEIAGILNVSIHTVETHRRRIRKKLGLTADENLTTHLVGMKD